MRLVGFYTSTIGSFPLEDSEENREKCLKDLINLGIDFPAYPQLKNMDKQFLEDLVRQNCGITMKNGRYFLNDSEISLDVSPPGLEPFNWAIKYLKEKGLRVKIKAVLTGPFTLSSYIEVDRGVFPFNTAISRIEVVNQIAQILAESCRVASREASMISIDEPILSVIVGRRIPFKYGEENIIKILNFLREGCGSILTGIHVCGRISPKLSNLLLKTNLDFLSHEFHDTPENMEAYNPKDLKNTEKILSVGCVSSRNPRVESVQEILSLMTMFKDYGECIIFTPDCGFRNLIVNGSREKGYEAAVKKLENMVAAVTKFREMRI